MSTIAQPPVTPSPVTPRAEGEKPALLAGKYADQPALEKGIREGVAKAGFDDLPEGDLIGEGKRFKDTAAAEKYYKGVEKIIGGGKPAEGKDDKPATADDGSLKLGGDDLPDDAAPELILAKAGVKQEDLVKQWNEKGALTEDQYAKIKAADPRLSRLNAAHARTIINQEMRLQKAESGLRAVAREKTQQDVATVVGGMDKLKALLADAPNFVDAADLPAYTRLINDPATAKATARTLMQMQAEHLGAAGSRPLVAGQPATGGGGAKSNAEFQAAARAADAGDAGARAIVDATPVEKIAAWSGMQ